MSFKIFLLPFFLVIHLLGFSQNQLNIYAGVNDYLGLSYERKFNNKTSIEIGSSFRTKKNLFTWIDEPSGNRENNLMCNFFFKKYKVNKNEKEIFYFGAYLRYWQVYNYRIMVDELSSGQQDFINNNERVHFSTKTNKISLGFLYGVNIPIYKNFNLGINLGLGSALPFSFWKAEVLYGLEKKEISKQSKDPWFGYTNYLSAVGQFSFGYTF